MEYRGFTLGPALPLPDDGLATQRRSVGGGGTAGSSGSGIGSGSGGGHHRRHSTVARVADPAAAAAALERGKGPQLPRDHTVLRFFAAGLV